MVFLQFGVSCSREGVGERLAPRACPLELTGPQRSGDGLDQEGLGLGEELVSGMLEPAGDGAPGTTRERPGHAGVERGRGATSTAGQGGEERAHPARGGGLPAGRTGLPGPDAHPSPLVLRLHRPAQGPGQSPEVRRRPEDHQVDLVRGGQVVDAPAVDDRVRPGGPDPHRDRLRDRAGVPEEALVEDLRSYCRHRRCTHPEPPRTA